VGEFEKTKRRERREAVELRMQTLSRFEIRWLLTTDDDDVVDVKGYNKEEEEQLPAKKCLR